MKKLISNHIKLYSTWILMLILTSCLSGKTVINQYEFFKQEGCDCITSHPLIVAGSSSNYYSKEKAICTRTNYLMRRDSIHVLQNLIYVLEENAQDEDSLKTEVIRMQGLINDLKKDWTHLKIKIKWKGSGDSAEIIILKQKIRYYNNFKPFRKHVGMEKLRNGKLVKSKLGKHASYVDANVSRIGNNL